MLATFGVYLKSSSYGMDTKPLLKEACSGLFGAAQGVVDMLVQHIPSSKRATASKVARDYSGEGDKAPCRVLGHRNKEYIYIYTNLPGFSSR